MSLTGKPPQDLCLNNLAVKDTLVATQTTALNVDAVTINKIPTTITLQPIRSVFTGAEIGQWVVKGGIETFYLLGLLNDSDVPQPAGTVLATVDNYCTGPFRVCQSPDSAFTFPAFIFCPEAATIDTAGYLVNVTVNKIGEVFIDALASSKDRIKGQKSKPELMTQIN